MFDIVQVGAGMCAQTIDEQDSAIADLKSQLQQARADVASRESQQAAAAVDSAALRSRLDEVPCLTKQQLFPH